MNEKAKLTELEQELLKACKDAEHRFAQIANLLTGHLTPERRREAYNLTYSGPLRDAIAKAEGREP